METIDLLPSVVTALKERTGELRRISACTGMSYDTILRIKNGENDPGYSKVLALYQFLIADEEPSDL